MDQSMSDDYFKELRRPVKTSASSQAWFWLGVAIVDLVLAYHLFTHPSW